MPSQQSSSPRDEGCVPAAGARKRARSGRPKGKWLSELVRSCVHRPGRQPEDRPGLNPGVLWVQLPLGPMTTLCVGWALASPRGCNPHAPAIAGSIPARRTLGPFDLRRGHGPIFPRQARTPHNPPAPATGPDKPQAPARGPRVPSLALRAWGALSRRGNKVGQVAESADAPGSRPGARRGVGVRVSPWSLFAGGQVSDRPS